MKSLEAATFTDRIKNDPVFAAKTFALQAAIKNADQPNNLSQTYFNTNPDLELDLRGCKEGGVSSSQFSRDELSNSEEHGIDDVMLNDYKQQTDELLDHPRYEYIKIAAQTLCFSELSFASTTKSTMNKVYDILQKSYEQGEVSNPLSSENFRVGESVTFEMFVSMIRDPDVVVMVAEVPKGKRGIIEDGGVVGCCCFSPASSSSLKTADEKNTAFIRLLAIPLKYQGLHIGRRMLKKVEKTMSPATHVIICIPSSRNAMRNWISKKEVGYVEVSRMKFPVDALEFDVLERFKANGELIVYEKTLKNEVYVSEGKVIRDTDLDDVNEIGTLKDVIRGVNKEVDCVNLDREKEKKKKKHTPLAIELMIEKQKKLEERKRVVREKMARMGVTNHSVMIDNSNNDNDNDYGESGGGGKKKGEKKKEESEYIICDDKELHIFDAAEAVLRGIVL